MLAEAWCKDLPDDWTSAEVKFLFDIQLGKMLQPEQQLPTERLTKYLKAQHVQWDSVITEDLPEMWSSPRNISQYRVKNGDLLVCEGGEVGRSAILKNLEETAIIQNALHRVRSSKNNVRFLNYVLRTVHSAGWFEVICNRATIAHFTRDKFGALRIPLPPASTQAQIATFLDRKTAAIDTLIAKKQRLIQLLEEKRAALINQAVTKGLNPNVPMKDSGIPWIGDIPEHWQILQVKRAFVLQRGVDITKDEQTEGEVPVVSSGGIASYHNTAYSKAPGIVIGRKGTLGKVYFLEKDYWPHDTTLWVINFYNNHPRFVYYKLLSMKLEAWDTGSANPTLNRNLIHPVKISWPFPKEQVQIADHLDKQSETIDRVVRRIEKQIGKLQEYRQSLITAAVTGKLEVPTNVVAWPKHSQ